MRKHTRQTLRRYLETIGLSVLCGIMAFTIGMRTSKEVNPFETSKAAESVVTSNSARKGDLNRNGMLDAHDALILLQIADGLTTATADERRDGDLNNDMRITTEDVRRLLHSMTLR